MSVRDPIEFAILSGASLALRRRAQRQARIAQDVTTVGDRGAIIRGGEEAIAQRIADALNELAVEFEAGAQQ
jgi:hypothetical protein